MADPDRKTDPTRIPSRFKLSAAPELIRIDVIRRWACPGRRGRNAEVIESDVFGRRHSSSSKEPFQAGWLSFPSEGVINKNVNGIKSRRDRRQRDSLAALAAAAARLQVGCSGVDSGASKNLCLLVSNWLTFVVVASDPRDGPER